MKRNRLIKCLVSCILLMAGCVSAFGQANVYHPFPVSKAGWIMDDGGEWCSHQASGPNPIEKVFAIRTDTLINGKTWHIVDSAELNYCHGWTGRNPSFACIREDSSKHVFVCCQVKNDTVSHLLYDFNMKVGDTLPTSYTKSASEQVVVYATDSILVGSIYLRQYLLKIIVPGHIEIDSIAEEVGNWQGLFAPISAYPKSIVLCFHHNSDMIEDSPNICDFGNAGVRNLKSQPVLSMFPNPAQNALNISVNLPDTKASLVIYTVQGALLRQHVVLIQGGMITEDVSSLPAGMYYLRLTSAVTNGTGGATLVITK